MKPIKTKIPVYLYLLHFDRPVRGKLHYAGTTLPNRVQERMREHLMGSGAGLTSQAHREQIGFTLVRLIELQDRAEEKTWKANGHYERHCPICSPKHFDMQLLDKPQHFAPLLRAQQFGVNFSAKPKYGDPF